MFDKSCLLFSFFAITVVTDVVSYLIEIPSVTSSMVNLRRGRSLPNDTLPDKFYGSFELDHSENFDEYMIAKGYGWLTRQFVNLATFKKVFARSVNKYLFDYSNLTSKKDIIHRKIRIGRKFIGEGLDSTKKEITFTVQRGHLFEHRKPLEKGEVGDEIYEYYFVEDWLVQKMSYKGIEGRRFFKRYE
ncbi:unnamed protein product [Caenorhabditis brenneri]